MASISAKRANIRANSSKATRPHLPRLSDDSAFSSTKKDKRTIKHSSFVNRIEKSSAKSTKRRRPNKKLAANLESLADALPDLAQNEGPAVVEVGQAKIQRKSLKSRPGAMKRKEKLERMERERFSKNLAQMASATASSGPGNAGTSIADRWAALKNHVQSTAEQKVEFLKT